MLDSLEGGSVKVYTGPRNGKFFINKEKKKIYLNRRTIEDNIVYRYDNVKCPPEKVLNPLTKRCNKIKPEKKIKNNIKL